MLEFLIINTDVIVMEWLSLFLIILRPLVSVHSNSSQIFKRVGVSLANKKLFFFFWLRLWTQVGFPRGFFFFLYFKSFYSVLSKSVQIRVNHVVEMVINKETTLWGLEFMATGIIIIVEIQPMTYYYYNFQWRNSLTSKNSVLWHFLTPNNNLANYLSIC